MPNSSPKESSGPLTAEQLGDVESIRSAGRGVARLLDDILNFARLGPGDATLNLTRVLVFEAVHRAEVLLKPRIDEAGLKYDRAEIPEELAVLADDYRLQQILLNVLVNAVKFTNAGGRISVRCRSKGDSVSIDISDTGVGIAAEHLGKIFEPFVKLEQETAPDKSSSGVGLGLAISRELALAMKGDLTVESESGKGSTFTVTLPAASEPR